jgi:hypothetical protein
MNYKVISKRSSYNSCSNNQPPSEGLKPFQLMLRLSRDLLQKITKKGFRSVNYFPEMVLISGVMDTS